PPVPLAASSAQSQLQRQKVPRQLENQLQTVTRTSTCRVFIKRIACAGNAATTAECGFDPG
ncbi:MAG: hypothetical protein ACK53Y_25805, partial [bacterium]